MVAVWRGLRGRQHHCEGQTGVFLVIFPPIYSQVDPGVLLQGFQNSCGDFLLKFLDDQPKTQSRWGDIGSFHASQKGVECWAVHAVMAQAAHNCHVSLRFFQPLLLNSSEGAVEICCQGMLFGNIGGICCFP